MHTNGMRPLPITNVDSAGLNNPKASWFITNGAAGHYDGPDTLITPYPYYTVYAQDTTYGLSKVTFHNCTQMTHEFIASGNGTVLDSATLYKERKCVGSSQGDSGYGNDNDGDQDQGS